MNQEFAVWHIDLADGTSVNFEIDGRVVLTDRDGAVIQLDASPAFELLHALLTHFADVRK